MSGHVLVPAFPEVLRVGLPVIHVDGPAVVARCVSDVVIILTDEHPTGVVVFADRVCVVRSPLSLDLRDPAVWDACLRALERYLDAKGSHPTPAPLNCPWFSYAPRFSLRVGAASYGIDSMVSRGAKVRGETFEDADSADVKLRALACALIAAFGAGAEPPEVAVLGDGSGR